MGGVCVKNVKDFNLALLCKWLWKLAACEDGLWARIIRQRYYARVRGWDMSLASQNISPTSQGILACRDFITTSAKVRMGNKDKCRFWKDRLCGNFTLEASFPRLYAVVAAPLTSVSQIFDFHMSGGAWAPTFMRNLKPKEMGQLEGLLCFLLDYTPKPNRED